MVPLPTAVLTHTYEDGPDITAYRLAGELGSLLRMLIGTSALSVEEGSAA